MAVDDLYAAWRDWCEAEGINRPGDKALFGRNLQAALPKVQRRQRREASARYGIYDGICLSA